MYTPAPWEVNPILESIEAFSHEHQFKIRLVDIPDMNESKEYQANAQLIAAAPELLAACKAVKISILDDAVYDRFKIVLKTLEKVINKAEGKP